MLLNLARMTEKQTVLLHLAALIALTMLAYLEVRHHHFVWDTIPFVLKNPWIHELNANNLVSIFTEAHRANWHPVVLLSHALDFSVFGDDAGKHHLTNLALHCINVLLLYWLVVNLLTRFHQTNEYFNMGGISHGADLCTASTARGIRSLGRRKKGRALHGFRPG